MARVEHALGGVTAGESLTAALPDTDAGDVALPPQVRCFEALAAHGVMPTSPSRGL